MPALDVRNFDKRIWLAGGRDQVPPGYCRLARGVALELTGSIKSMWPPQLLYPNIAALNLIRYNNNRIAYDGSKLYVNGSAVYSTGFNGQRGTFTAISPTTGVQDYLFMCGGGQNIKMDPLNNVTNWGIEPPVNSLQASNLAQESIVIDNFNASSSNWATTNCTVANESTEYITGTGSLKVSAVGGPWHIINSTTFTVGSAPIDLGNFASGDLSLPTDVISFWFFYAPSSGGLTFSNWLQIDFDVDDGTFKKQYYTIVMQLTPPGSTTPVTRVNPAVTFSVQPNQWQQFYLAKQQFTRVGSALWQDWTNVVAVRISGDSSFDHAYFDNLQVLGGAALGQGPAVMSGGSEYSYYAVYRNETTGTQSNPQDTASNVQGVAVNRVSLTNVPVSTDTQVGARDLYRTSAENTGPGQTAFYLDTIYDNTTTTYTDSTADTSVPLTLTPWKASQAVPPNSGAIAYYVDGGNGYIFKLTTSGTTGAGVPQWNIPTAIWSALSTFLVGETVAPLKAAGQFWEVTTAGTTGTTQPNWAANATPGDTVTDGSVVWTNLGTKTTTDDTAVWTFYGVNSTPVLGTQSVLLDNGVVPATINDCAGPFQGSLVSTRDTNPGFKGAVYISPPGRNEAIGTVVFASTDDDACQKAIVFQQQLWILTQTRILQINGTYPDGTAGSGFTVTQVYTECGTNYPFTVGATEVDVFYRSSEGMRAFNWAQDRLIAFDPVAPVFRGYQVEDIPPFAPIICGMGRDEIIFSDTNTLAMGLGYVRQFWRTWNIGFSAIYYDDDVNEILTSYGGNVYLWEHPTLVGSPLAFAWEVQTGGVEINPAVQPQSQRLYLDINTGNQLVTPTLLVDNSSYVLPAIQNTTRQTIELPIQVPGFLYSVNLTANPSTGIIEVFRVALDITAT